MTAALYLVVASHLGTQMPGGARTREEALARFDDMVSTTHVGVFAPYTGSRLRVVSEQQWLGSQAIQARQEVER